MPKTFNGSIDFTTNFNVQTTKPLDNRLVVDSFADLTNGSIEAPYQGMVVNIAGTSELWILKTAGIANSHIVENWELVTGSGTSEEVEARIREIRESLGVLTDIVGLPGTESDGPTGIFEEIENLKKSGSGLGKYSIPVMTPEMATLATEDPDVEFDESETTHILVDDERLVMNEEKEDVYFGMIHSMMSVIRELQAEVTRLKKYFDYGIDSYQGERTTLSEQENLIIGDEQEPMWAIDPGIGLEIVSDNPNFYTGLDSNYKFEQIGAGRITSVTTSKGENRLVFDDCKGVFYDGNSSTATEDKLTLYPITDSKLITYLVTDKPDIKVTFLSLDKTRTKEVNIADLIPEGKDADKYGFCIVLSRKDSTTGKGFNYIYFSIIDFIENVRICDGYLQGDTLVSKYIEDSEHPELAYTIQSIEFDRLTLYRMKFYTKYEDFSLFDDKEVIPVQPDKEKYEVAHIAIRAVADTDQLNKIFNKGGLVENELIWNKKAETLHIMSGEKLYRIGSNSNINPDDDNNNDNIMTDKEIIQALKKMGIIVNVEYSADEYGEYTVIKSLNHVSLAPVADITFINQETGNKFKYSVDSEGNLVGKYAGNENSEENTIEDFLNRVNPDGYDQENYQAVRGFICDYLSRKSGKTKLIDGVNKSKDTGKQSDRLRFSSFYAPIVTDEKHGCTHSFIELENTSEVDIPLTGIYLHFFNPAENHYHKDGTDVVLDEPAVVHHLALDGVIKAGGTYLIRGAKHAEFDDESAFIKVKTFDKEWYENGKPISFEQVPGVEKVIAEDGSSVPTAYRFCLTYGLPNLGAKEKLVQINSGDNGIDINGVNYPSADFPNIILNPRFIDSCSYSTSDNVSKQYGVDNPWYAKGDAKGVGITIVPNSMFRLMFALDPAKQAFNGFNTKDSSRVRYNKAQDIQVLTLDKEFIGFPNSPETIKIERFTPKASFDNRNIMTDKTPLDREKPNMVTCSLGNDVYNTRCFNWISCGTFDEYVWLRKEGETEWTAFESYTKQAVASDEDPTLDDFVLTTTNEPIRKRYSKLVNNAAYARMINRFPGNDVLFTSHKCVVILPDATTEPVKYEYVVGRPDKDGNPDFNHTNEIYTFTVYPRTYEGRLYQVTDQQGFHWIEYQVWAAAAEFLNGKIKKECDDINEDADTYNQTYASEIGMGVKQPKTKVFPILLNTGDMTQSGARINEWLDYYNAGKCLFNHLEQMNCVGNNDLCPINPRELGTGNDNNKSSSHFFHYFYCFDVKDTAKYSSVSNDSKKFFSGETFVIKAHQGTVGSGDSEKQINITENKYIPSFYYFKTKNVMYVIVNSEIPLSNCQEWFGLCSSNNQYVNIYTGIECVSGGNYAGNEGYFTPLYETMYAWLKDNQDEGINSKKVVVAMHEMPFTVITNTSLKYNDSVQIPCTRNHPTNGNRLGSNVNQLDSKENRGIYWCSRLLEYFGCKLVIGGHKHTFALSYPIKEKYTWSLNGAEPVDSATQIKTMLPTLADEAGANPTCLVSWDIDLTSDAVRNEYKITTVREGTAENPGVENSVKLNSTKTPYIPENLYNDYGLSVYNSSEHLFRCCKPIAVNTTDSTGNDYNPNYDGFVTYSMCQATGYKLKSNKELPSTTQLFSKIIPKTKHQASGDKPHESQLYPMYSILEFSDDCSELFVSMNRIRGIFASDDTDTFTQNQYGTGEMNVQTLCTGPDLAANVRMYGTWLSEDAASLRDPDNRYLHIKF